ncbi:protein of unknown function [Fontibacillus panacisegetis]|uniref:DUF4367 domain-containing protein n=1 Tax=Fontibacillus panacisegetis TaxID=670482 RepID=A0A1G7MX65_9BACL|nr:DUF4367 domain-containing protein [Fontibacillus panacisegetis]SDF66398.1 protein of unknown function [Fontibacillus panacisegetis]
MMNEPNEQDRIIQKALQDYYNRIEIPDAAPSWEKVHVQMQKRRCKKKTLFRLKIVAAVIAAAFMIDLAATTNITKTYASMSSLFREAKDRVVEFFFAKEQHDTSAAKTVPPPSAEGEGENPAVPEPTTLEDAKAKLAFPLLLPSYVPDHFSLEVVRIFREASGQYHNVYLEYMNDNEDIFKISQRFIEPGSTHVKSDVSTDVGVIRKTMIGNSRGILVIVPEGFVTLEWLTEDQIKVSISGKLAETDVLEIAESLR